MDMKGIRDAIRIFILKNWKTTTAGFMGVVFVVLGRRFGFELTPEEERTVGAFALLIVAILAKDANKGGAGPADPTAGDLTPKP